MIRRNCSKSAFVKGGDDASDLAFFFFRSSLLGAISISSLAPLGFLATALGGCMERKDDHRTAKV